jgi:tetratricopeptide (TPR) repeat protein
MILLKRKIAILLLLISFSVTANVDHRRAQLIGVIDQELREVTRINQQSNSNNPTLLLRMAELLLEKARLIKEQENTRFLELPPQQRSRVNRNQFFGESKKYFDQAQKTCEFILSRFRNFEDRGDVFYIMAYNAKEFNQLQKAKEFFAQAVRAARPGTTVKQRSEIALAEMHFNNNEYRQARPLYESALLGRGEKERWWTKDAYNLSWTYFRLNDSDKAINLMKQVHALSGNPNYVDMSSSVERDLAYFYTEAGRANEAVSFIKGADGQIATNLLRMARNLIGQGKFAAAESTLIEAQKHQMDESVRIDIFTEQIALYERFGKEEEHLRAAQAMFQAHREGKLNSEQLNILKYQASRAGALLQQQVAAKTYERQPAIRQAKARRSVAYFDMMRELDPKTAHNSVFFSGETLYAIGDVNNSIKYYDQALELSQRAQDRKVFSQALQGMMMSLGATGVTKETEQAYLEKAFRLQIATNPNDPKNEQIFQRLFNLYTDRNDLENAEKTLIAFKQRYPRANSTQEAMVAKIMEVHQNNKNHVELTKWVARIDRGEFRVSDRFLQQAKLLLLTMQFESVEKLNTDGEKKAALRGYLQIYRSELSSVEAKKNAAYNIASLFYELDNIDLTHQWTLRALSEMTPEDINKFDSTFLQLGGFFYNRRRFEMSAEIFQKSFSSICRLNNRNKNLFFQNTVLLYLASDQYDKAIALVDEAYKCNVPNASLIQAQLDILKAQADDGQWSGFRDYLAKVERVRETWGELISLLSRYREALANLGRVNEVRAVESKILRFYTDARSRNLAIPLEGLDVVAELKLRDVMREVSVLRNIQLTFPEERHTQGLKALFEQLDKVTTLTVDLMDTKSGEGIVNGYKTLVESYEYVVAIVRGFTPPDRPEEYVTSFRQSMVGLTEPLNQKVREFRAEASRQIQASQILAENNFFFTRDTPSPVDLRYRPLRGALLMDRGGRR